jgi:drug/metabolite transporter (DMT)-like permease
LSARAWAAFAAVSVLWGIPYFFIKVAIDDGVPPAFLAWIRVTIGAALLAVLCWRLGLFKQLRGHGRTLAFYAIVEIAIPFPLISFGEEHVSSSLAAILIATVPLLVALLAIRFDPSERATGSRLIGLLIGFGGVVLLVGLDVAGDPDEVLGAAAILVAAVGYAIGPMVLKLGLGEVDIRAIMCGALAIAAVVLLPFAAADLPPSSLPAEAIISIGVLAVFCTALAFVLFGMLNAEVGPSRSSVITYVAPVVALALGVAALDERPGAGTIIGFVLILAGSYLATSAEQRSDSA